MLVTDGVDAGLLDGAEGSASKAEGAMLKLVAPEVGGVEGQRRHLDRGRREDRRRAVGPLRRRRDPAVAPMVRRCWPRKPTARDFVADAFAHAKFIALCRAGARRCSTRRA